MPRFFASLVAVTACAPLAPSARSIESAHRTERADVALSRNERAPDAHAARLRPPFGASAGVRRVTPEPDVEPTVIAAVDRD